MKPGESGLSYRNRIKAGGLVGFRVVIEQTDLYIRAARDLTGRAFELAAEGRGRIEDWAARDPEFLTSLEPRPPSSLAPLPVREMLSAGISAGVGPMAAVAGALAEYVGRGLKSLSPQGVIVENGGDVFLDVEEGVTVGLFAGISALSLKLGLSLAPDQTPAGLCTSSGTVGHSLSLGRADAATVLAETGALADAAATALGNRIRTAGDIEPALAWVLGIAGVRGAAVVLGDRIGLLGDLNLVSI